MGKWSQAPCARGARGKRARGRARRLPGVPPGAPPLQPRQKGSGAGPQPPRAEAARRGARRGGEGEGEGEWGSEGSNGAWGETEKEQQGGEISRPAAKGSAFFSRACVCVASAIGRERKRWFINDDDEMSRRTEPGGGERGDAGHFVFCTPACAPCATKAMEGETEAAAGRTRRVVGEGGAVAVRATF